MPSSEPAASASAMSLRRPTVLRPRLALRLWSGLRLRLGRRLAETALEVVEDEPRRGLGRRGRGDHRLALADDEQASVAGRGLELRDVAFGRLRSLLEQRAR